MSVTDAEASSQQARRNRKLFIILWLIPVALMAAAWAVYYLVQSGRMTLGSVNEGALIQPPFQISELSMTTVDGKPLEQAISGKWTLIITAANACDETCRQRLYLTRQVHIRLNKDAPRVQRAYISSRLPLDADLQSFLSTEHPRLLLAQASPASLQRIQIPVDSADAAYVLVDPQGWVMMYYDGQHEAGQLMKDLKRLLKFSRDS